MVRSFFAGSAGGGIIGPTRPQALGDCQGPIRPHTPVLVNGAYPALYPGMPPAAPFLAAQKWGKKPPGRPRSPSFCPIGPYQKRYLVATEFLIVPRNRSGGYPTSPDGPRADRHFLSRRTSDESTPSKGRQPKPDKQTAADQIQKNWLSGRAASNLIETDWAKDSKTLVLALFGDFCAYKSHPGVGPGRPHPVTAGRGGA